MVEVYGNHSNVRRLSEQLLSVARSLPKHSLAIRRKNVSKLAIKMLSLERVLLQVKLTPRDEDSIRLCLSEIHFIISEYRYN